MPAQGPRRRNGSKKIPNVILRPAAPLPPDGHDGEDNGQEEEEDVGFDPSTSKVV